MLTPAGLVFRIAVNAIAGMTIVSILSLFEEIGSRGWLLPHLIGLTPRGRGFVHDLGGLARMRWWAHSGLMVFRLDGPLWPYHLESSAETRALSEVIKVQEARAPD